MIKLDAPVEGAEVERVDLFAIGPDVYAVPAKPGANIALQYLRDVRKYGAGLAEMGLLEKMLGAKGFEALCSYDALTSDQLEQITETAAKLAMGALESEGGNVGGESPKSAG